MIAVFDSCAIIALLRNETGGDVTRSFLEDTGITNLIHSVNLCEIYYDALRVYGESRADELLVTLQEAGLLVRDDMDEQFWKTAGRIKAGGRISLADCFAAALTLREDALLITADRHEFEPLATNGVLQNRVRFIR